MCSYVPSPITTVSPYPPHKVMFSSVIIIEIYTNWDKIVLPMHMDIALTLRHGEPIRRWSLKKNPWHFLPQKSFDTQLLVESCEVFTHLWCNVELVQVLFEIKFMVVMVLSCPQDSNSVSGPPALKLIPCPCSETILSFVFKDVLQISHLGLPQWFTYYFSWD